MQQFLLELADLMEKHGVDDFEVELTTYEVYQGVYDTETNMVINCGSTFVQKDNTRYLTPDDIRKLAEEA